MNQPLPLHRDELLRYQRQIDLAGFGMEAQMRLKAARVLCVGLGGLGSPLALYLAAAGVGTLGLIDHDRVDLTNLQRQVLHSTADVGQSKLDSAARQLKALNPHVNIELHRTRLERSNAFEILRGYDVIADGSDNFPTRYLVNDACLLLGKPLVWGAVSGFEGQASVFGQPEGPCYRCLHPEPPPAGAVMSCAEGGVVGVLPGIIGTVQATEVLKIISGIGETLSGRLLLFDALGMRFRELRLRKRPGCPLCGERPSITQLQQYAESCTPGRVEQISPRALQALLKGTEKPLLLDVREPGEYALENLGGVLIPAGEVAERTEELPRSGMIVVHCQSGARSQKVAEMLLDKGFTRVVNLAGGLRAWQAESAVAGPSSDAKP